jgi:hypothetical protein
LAKHIGDAKRLLISLCQCPRTASVHLWELASSALQAEELVIDLARSIRLRQRARPMRLAPHEVQVIETAFMLDRSIELALRRVIEPAAGAVAIH